MLAASQPTEVKSLPPYTSPPTDVQRTFRPPFDKSKNRNDSLMGHFANVWVRWKEATPLIANTGYKVQAEIGNTNDDFR